MTNRPHRPIHDSWEKLTEIPIEIRERIWGGEGVMGGLPAAPKPPRLAQTVLRFERTHHDLLAVLRRLRRSQRDVGTVYGGSDEPRPLDEYRTRKIAPNRPQTLRDVER